MSSLLKSTLNTRALPTGNLRYIRSDYPGNLSKEEVNWLLKNNVVTVIDLREEKEYQKNICILESEPGFTYCHLPVTGGADIPASVEEVADIYLGMLDEQMNRIISTILKARTNVLFFCTAGKDRTGVVSAVLLKRLGFDDDVIIEDYMKSKDNLFNYLTTYVESHPEIDIEIENSAKKYALDNDNFIIDARLGWYAVPESFKVYLKVDIDEAAKRAFNDEKRKDLENFSSFEDHKRALIERFEEENKRYFNLYGVRKDDMNNYDLVVDTTSLTPEEVADIIIKEYKTWKNE